MVAPDHGSVLLAQFLDATELRQCDFAQAVEVSPWQISHLINWRRKPSLDLAQRIDELTQGTVPATSWQGRPQRDRPK